MTESGAVNSIQPGGNGGRAVAGGGGSCEAGTVAVVNTFISVTVGPAAVSATATTSATLGEITSRCVVGADCCSFVLVSVGEVRGLNILSARTNPPRLFKPSPDPGDGDAVWI